MDIKKLIRKICMNIEKEKNIKILFAVENGSRAWRMHSKDSDYDIRFAFKRSLKEYIQINMPSEVIQFSFNKKGEKCKQISATIDISGFDIFKFTKMLSSSNPTTIEWLTSDIIYYGRQNEIFKKFALKNFSRISLYHHYKSMGRQNYLKYLKSGNLVSYKKYSYAYRGLVNAKWIVHKKSIPPIIFKNALKEMKNIIPENILKKIAEIMKLKSKEKDIIQNIAEMDKYIGEFLKDDREAPKEKAYSTLNELNSELRNIVLKK